MFGVASGFGAPVLPPREAYEEDSNVVREQMGLVSEWVMEGKYVVFVTGAGVSTRAGVRDLRGDRGHVNRKYEGKPQAQIGASGYENPTVAHMAIASLVGAGAVRRVITTNTDGLHEASGVPDDKLCLLRGTATHLMGERASASKLGATVAEREAYRQYVAANPMAQQERVVVSAAGLEAKAVAADELAEAEAAMLRADVCVIVGASLTSAVHQLPLLMGEDGKIVVIGLQESPLDGMADVLMRVDADTALLGILSGTGVGLDRYVVRKHVVVIGTLIVDPAVGKAPGRRHWRVCVSDKGSGPLDVDEVLFEVPPAVDGPQHTLINANPFELLCESKSATPAGDVAITLFFRKVSGEDFAPYPPVSFLVPLPESSGVTKTRVVLEYDPLLTQAWTCVS